MKYFVFPYSISFGKLDSIGGDVKHGLSDDKANRLIRSAEEGGRYRLGEDTFISDICDEIQTALDKKLIAQLRRDPTPVRDALSWNADFDPEKPIGKKEIQDMIDEGKDIEVKCHFCNTAYKYTVDELKDILKRCKR